MSSRVKGFSRKNAIRDFCRRVMIHSGGKNAAKIKDALIKGDAKAEAYTAYSLFHAGDPWHIKIEGCPALVYHLPYFAALDLMRVGVEIPTDDEYRWLSEGDMLEWTAASKSAKATLKNLER